jgi:hypothetical protein
MLLPDIEAEIKHYEAASKACPHCPFGCYCDGDWGPEANLTRLYEEKRVLEEKMMVSSR